MVGGGAVVFNIPLISTIIGLSLFILSQIRAHEFEGQLCGYTHACSWLFPQLSMKKIIADRLGLEYIARACFDPEAAVRLVFYILSSTTNMYLIFNPPFFIWLTNHKRLQENFTKLHTGAKSWVPNVLSAHPKNELRVQVCPRLISLRFRLHR